MNKRLLIGGLALIALVGAVIWYVNSTPTEVPVGGVACPMDAKLCPDGSYVSRTGPTCEFSQCQTVASNGISIGSNAKINGTTIGVLELVEDSRCPVDVQCIQAGTVRVRTSIDSYNSDFTFTLLTPQVVNNATITLVSVIPVQKYSTQSIALSDYRFLFTVTPVVTPTPLGSGIRGTVLLGPTCPVMRDPPDPNCADRPYQTSISIFRASDLTSATVKMFASTKSAADGTFEVSLPPGEYVVGATGGEVMPRCAQVSASVPANGYTKITVSCDSGIR